MVSKALTVGFPCNFSVWLMYAQPNYQHAQEVGMGRSRLDGPVCSTTCCAEKHKLERDTSSLRSIEPKHDYVRQIGGKYIFIVKATEHQENRRP